MFSQKKWMDTESFWNACSNTQVSGIGAGIIPSVLDTELYDEVIKIHSDDAIAMAKRMAREEGILCGTLQH